jgi:hypothetical protein
MRKVKVMFHGLERIYEASDWFVDDGVLVIVNKKEYVASYAKCEWTFIEEVKSV